MLSQHPINVKAEFAAAERGQEKPSGERGALQQPKRRSVVPVPRSQSQKRVYQTRSQFRFRRSFDRSRHWGFPGPRRAASRASGTSEPDRSAGRQQSNGKGSKTRPANSDEVGGTSEGARSRLALATLTRMLVADPVPRAAPRPPACPRAILHRPPGAADCRRSQFLYRGRLFGGRDTWPRRHSSARGL
jgi:hypothetical protein